MGQKSTHTLAVSTVSVKIVVSASQLTWLLAELIALEL